MKVTSERYGFACNSSSTHACVVVKQKVEDDYEDKDFGWDYFTVTSKKGIYDYFVTMLKQQIESALLKTLHSIGLEWRLASETAASLTKELLPENYYEHYEVDSYVDHQSVIHFPTRAGSKLPDMKFAISFIEAAANTEDLAILGGNDNDEVSHPLSHYKAPENDFGLAYKFMSNPSSVVGEGPTYTLFNPSNGHKLRVNFGEDNKPCSDYPELVDLKITNYCDFGCKYCYQASTEEGAHAEFRIICSILSKLGAAEVLEVAIGGGEPTYHPDFLKILLYARDKNIIPNFTTRSVEWLHEPQAKSILKAAGAVAFSINTYRDLEAVWNAYLPFIKEDNYYDKEYAQLVFQVVVGTTTKEDLRKIVEFVNRGSGLDYNDNEIWYRTQLTLLGYKDVGFGPNYKKQDYSWLEEILFNADIKLFHIDTALAQEIEPLLIKHKIDKRHYSVKEGTHSCYIDACTGLLYKDSYSSNEGINVLEKWGSAKDIKPLFQQMQVNAGIRS